MRYAALPKGFAALPLVVAALLLTGCGGGGSGSTSSASNTGGASAPPSSPDAVTIANYTFEPAQLTVAVAAGTTVEFTNEDSTPHTATSKQSGAFDTGSIDTGKSAKVTLKEPGTYDYYCAFHPFMKGTVTVE